VAYDAGSVRRSPPCVVPPSPCSRSPCCRFPAWPTACRISMRPRAGCRRKSWSGVATCTGIRNWATGRRGPRRPSTTTCARGVPARVVEWRGDLHRQPDLGNREPRTAQVVADHLRALGLGPRTGIGPTGVVAVLKGGRPGPRIALRADMDALPVTEATGLPYASTVRGEYRGQPVGVMHACGHDMHVAILMGVAQALVGMREELPGEVMFIFQPAEEGPPVAGEVAGAQRMLDEGIWDDFRPDAV